MSYISNKKACDFGYGSFLHSYYFYDDDFLSFDLNLQLNFFDTIVSQLCRWLLILGQIGLTNSTRRVYFDYLLFQCQYHSVRVVLCLVSVSDILYVVKQVVSLGNMLFQNFQKLAPNPSYNIKQINPFLTQLYYFNPILSHLFIQN